MIAINRYLDMQFPCVVALMVSCLLVTPGFAENDAPYELSDSDDAPELTEEAEKAIGRGLQFLIASQNKDGSWTPMRVGITRLPVPVWDSWHSWWKATSPGSDVMARR